MLYEERSKIIIKNLEEKTAITTRELTKLLNISEATVRRDLDNLEKEGKIARVHGGAVLKKFEVEEATTEEKFVSNIIGKQIIGKIAANLVEDTDVIYLDAGTTTFEMIPFLKNRDVTVVTNGIMHIEKLIEYEIKCYLIGGYIKKSTKALIGAMAINNLKSINFSKAFIGANGVDIKSGYTTPDVEEAILKSKALDNSLKSYILADKSKFGRVYFSKIADLNRATIISDSTKELNKDIFKKTQIIGG